MILRLVVDLGVFLKFFSVVVFYRLGNEVYFMWFFLVFFCINVLEFYRLFWNYVYWDIEWILFYESEEGFIK